MAVWLPERRTLAVGQMGGEGATWIGLAPFRRDAAHLPEHGRRHLLPFGYLAIRAAVAANVNITYKILVNGAVAMTGGQPIEGEPMAGEITTPEIVQQLQAEGLERIAVVSDDSTSTRAASFRPNVRCITATRSTSCRRSCAKSRV